MEENLTPKPSQAPEADNLPEANNLPVAKNQPAEVQPAAETQLVAESPSWEAEADTDESEPTGRGISKKWALIGGILFVFLAAAVFLGAQLLKPPAAVEGGGGKGPGIAMMSGKAGGKSFSINLTPAKELPTEQPATAGLFVRREDQSLFLGTGNVRMMAKKQAGSNAPDDISSSYDGPVVEVVVNHDTQVYQDITEMTPPDESNSSGETTIQQVVKTGSIDDISKNTLVSVWGEKRGDRIIATAISFR